MSLILPPTEVVYHPTAAIGQRELGLWLRKGAPVVVVIQYGGWLNTPYYDDYQKPWIRSLWDEGFSVVGFNWRFTTDPPVYQYPIPMQDVDLAIRAAMRYIAIHYETWTRPNRTHINLLGLSSGAHLALLWALNRQAYSGQNYNEELTVDSVVSVAGVCDLTDDLMFAGGPYSGFTAAFIDYLLQGTPPIYAPTPPYQKLTAGTQDYWARQASPITYAPLASRYDTKYLFQYGSADDLIPFATQSSAMSAALNWDGGSRSQEEVYFGIGPNIGNLGAPWYEDITIWESDTYTADEKAGWESRFQDAVSFINSNL